MIYGLILDISGIQNYIFSSNYLKTNIGASNLIEKAFDIYLKTTIQEESLTYKNRDWNYWKEHPDEITILEEKIDVEIGYIGGGNAILLFKDEMICKTIIKNWHKMLLVKTPGLKTNLALSSIQTSSEDKPEKITYEIIGLVQKLKRKLDLNKRNETRRLIFPKLGITEDCVHTGLSSEIYMEKSLRKGDNDIYVSSTVASKIKNAEQATIELKEQYEKQIPQISSYQFPNNLDQLGDINSNSSNIAKSNFIAISHIDGNSIGEKFKECKTLSEVRKLSVDLENNMKTAFKELLSHIIKNSDVFIESNSKILPIRPIIIGGDDITFICKGIWGIYFTKFFMDRIIEKSIIGGDNISVCSGIGIVKLKYPFYRAYQLAIELCDQAKEVAKSPQETLKSDDKIGSWINYLVANTGYTGSLNTFIEKNYITPMGCLLHRPYRVEKNQEINDYRSFHKFVEKSEELRTDTDDYKKWSRSKLMEFQNTLYKSQSQIDKFVTHIKHRGLKIPSYLDSPMLSENIYVDHKTPYYDLIEFLEFYPFDKLNQLGNGGQHQ